MNNQSQPGTQGYVQPTVNTQGSAFRTISAQYGQEASVFGSLDAKAARSQGEKLAREALKGFESVLQESETFNKILQKRIDSMDVFRKKAELTGEALKEHNKHYNELKKAQDQIAKVQAAISQEMKKAEPDEKKVLDLEIKRVEAQAKAEQLAAKTADQKRLEYKMMEKQKVLQEDSAEASQKIEELNTQILALRNAINDTEAESNAQMEEYINKLEKGKKVLNESKATLKQIVTQFRDSLNTIFDGVDKIWDAFDFEKKIDRWTIELDEFTKKTYELANVWGTDYQSGFQSFKNDLISEINSDGAFNPTQLNQAMKDLTQFTFDSKETLMGMAKDFTYAKEYMGMQSDTLQEMYGMQIRSNDDAFFKKSMSTIISLQKSGIQVSEEQLNQTIKSSMTLTDAMVANGMSFEDVANFNSSLAELKTIADATMGPGYGDLIQSQMESIIKNGWDSIAELGPTAVNGYLKVLSGNGNAYDLLDAVMNSEGANVYGNIYGSGNPYATTIIGSGEASFGGLDAGLYRAYQNNIDDFTNVSDTLNDTIEYESELEERIADVLERMPDAFKDANKMAEATLAVDWEMISEQQENRKFFGAVKEEVMNKIDAVMGVISVVAGIVSLLSTVTLAANTAAINANTIAHGGSSIFGNIGGKVASFGTASNTLGGAISSGLGGGKLATAAGTMANGLVVTGGVIAAGKMVSDGISVGTKGFTNTSGERIDGSGGLKSGLAGAFAGSEVKDSSLGNIGGGALGGAGKGAAIGAAIGTIVPGIGTAIGAGVGALIGGVGGLLGGLHKDSIRKAEEQRKELEHQTELAEEIKAASLDANAIMKASLVDRYGDMRNGPQYGVGGPSMHSEIHPAKRPSMGGGTVGGAEDPYRGGSKKNGTLSAHDATDNNTKYKGVPLAPYVFTSRYGWRDYKGITWHSGIDFSKYQDITQPIGAAYDGVVTDLVTGNDPYGSKANYVAVYHKGQGVTGLYYHMSKAADGLKVGDEVKAGNIIGYQGSSGESTGPHLHFQVNRGEGVRWGQDIDPGPYVTTGIFSPGGPVVGVQSDDDDEDGSNALKPKSMEAMAVMPSATPGINVGEPSPSDFKHDNVQEFKSRSIEGKLDTLNKTLLGMQAKQDKQDEILKALTNTPIYDYGV